MKHHSSFHKSAFFTYSQKYFMPSQEKKMGQWDNDPKPNPWPLAGGHSILHSTYNLSFQSWPLLLLPGLLAMNETLPVENDQQGFSAEVQGICVWNDSALFLIGTTLTLGTHFSLSCLPCRLNQDSDSFEFFTFSLSLLGEPLGHL